MWRLIVSPSAAGQEKIVEAQPDFGPAWCALGMIDAGLGRKEEALREGRRALELLALEKDALVGQYLARYFAVIAAWVGEKDLACEQLAVVVQPPSNASLRRRVFARRGLVQLSFVSLPSRRMLLSRLSSVTSA